MHVGVDLVNVEDVQEAITHHGGRYLNRVYTDRELRQSRSEPHRLAARFAAKEAAMKALGRSDQGFGWRAIEVVSSPDGQPTLRLEGDAAKLATRRRWSEISVSLTHEAQYAMAMVVAEVSS